MTQASVHFPVLGSLCCDECSAPAARRPWTVEDVRAAHELRRAGVTVVEIGRRTGIEAGRVARLLGEPVRANDPVRLCVICGEAPPREGMLACIYCAMAA